MTATKPILQQFVAWLETAYGDSMEGAASEFAVEPPPETLAFAEMALEAALKTGGPVILGTDLPVKTLLGALVMKRAGVRLEQILEHSLTEDQFKALADALGELKASNLLIDLPWIVP